MVWAPVYKYIVEARGDERRWDDCARRARGAFAAAQSRRIECHDANRTALDPLPPALHTYSYRIPCASASQGRVQPLLVAVQLHIFDQRVEHALHLVRVRARARVKVRVRFRDRVRVRV